MVTAAVDGDAMMVVMLLRSDDPVAVATVAAIREGDLLRLDRLLDEHPGLAAAEISEGQGADRSARSLLHVVTDWPGHFPGGASTVRTLVAAGSDPNARFVGRHSETPLHWAASTDDVDVIEALLEAGADIEASGAVIGGGTAMADATAFGQWNAARTLLERGAATTLWEAAAIGLLDRVRAAVEALDDDETGRSEITAAFWGACHGGHRDVAGYLWDRGADVNWIGWDDLTALDAAIRSGADDLAAWLVECGGQSAEDLR